MGLIYKATNLINNKAYVGQTIKTLSKRKASHEYTAIERNSNYLFHNAIRKYGFANFEWEIIKENINNNNLNNVETYYIKKYNTLCPNGYNLVSTGNGHVTSEKTRKKMSLQKLGRKNSKETIEKIRQKLLGRNYSKEIKKQISETLKKRFKDKKNHPWYGKHCSVEHKEKIRQSNSGKVCSNETRKKISESLVGINHPMFGKKFSEKRKQNISNGIKLWWENKKKEKYNENKISV